MRCQAADLDGFARVKPVIVRQAHYDCPTGALLHRPSSRRRLPPQPLRLRQQQRDHHLVYLSLPLRSLQPAALQARTP